MAFLHCGRKHRGHETINILVGSTNIGVKFNDTSSIELRLADNLSGDDFNTLSSQFDVDLSTSHALLYKHSFGSGLLKPYVLLGHSVTRAEISNSVLGTEVLQDSGYSVGVGVEGELYLMDGVNLSLEYVQYTPDTNAVSFNINYNF